MSLLVKTLLTGVTLYAALVAALAFFQHSLVFPRHMVSAPPSLPAQAERLRISTPDGAELHGVRIPGSDPSRPILLGFPGNAWNAEAMALFLHQVSPTQTVVVFHYRGYAPSTGTPSAQALMSDAIAIHDTLGASVTALGFSIGSGVAAHLAAMRDLEQVVLVTPFDSLAQVAADSLPYLPVRWLFRHEMAAAKALARNGSPVTLIIADRDEVIPAKRSDALALALPQARVIHLNAGHNDIYNQPEFVPALRRALR
ncbi:alpha/beta hydrolase [Roseibaca sp. V10]|uniref:Alpha/beta hydrolase n=1 Tax=Roseinatronobacter domitianus TaxID=2940293 RepID=A0ABT0LZX4_9RHOB|nr:alpha/beta hydrolase [Roseibaca domitiana]MCL1628171.1 alpha/beta hydrolase [Roseibaca domitiana]